jgi:hypothetical protein
LKQMMSKNQFHNCSSHKYFSSTTKNSYLVCTNFQIFWGGRKKTTHLRKARTGADLLNTYYWGFFYEQYLIRQRQNCVSCMYKFCMQLLLLLLLSSLEIGREIT